MTPDAVGALVAAMGLLSQTGTPLLLAGLFAALLRSRPRPQPYFRQWTLGYGMVVLRMEDEGRENADARSQLAMAHDRLR